ncbi:hypothetical protein [Paenibacillus sp. FSL R7-0652]|uniref:hypothetical protein n=1 Tax=Paenibacillus sp. FSL R7-0652 TaxID=2921687 RepID=UPI00315B3E08
MSLTSLLTKNEEIKKLFSEVPNMKALFKSPDNESPFPSKPSIIVPRLTSVAPVIGNAYDYWLRAYAQRINGISQEHDGDSLVASISVNYLSEQIPGIVERYHQIIERRIKYIDGTEELNTSLLEDCIFLGYLDQYYRSGYMTDNNTISIQSSDVEELHLLTQASLKNSHLFKMKQDLNCNPTFGSAISQLVNGADGDLILDGTLIEIKTESTFAWKVGHLRQLIGYWVLSCLTPDFEDPIKALAIWNPRYCRMVTISVEDICQTIDMVKFVDDFIKILSRIDSSNPDKRKFEMRSKWILEVEKVWKAKENPIRQYYAPESK